jgi:uncharacterized repeat protein (TIGR03803 family)
MAERSIIELYLTVERSMKPAILLRARSILAAGVLFAFAGLARANTETVLYSFQGSPDGANPLGGPLLIDATRAIYGTTWNGGVQCLRNLSCGTVFKLVRGSDGVWHETTIYAFNRITYGMQPFGPVLEDANGAIYGVTDSGGAKVTSNNTYGGVVFKLSPPTATSGTWTERVLHKFSGPPSDGQTPTSLISDGAGGFYGTTSFGCICQSGPVFSGTIFHLTPPARAAGIWTETILHTFTGSDGQLPNGPLLLDANGNLYGTTSLGGPSWSGPPDTNYGDGTAFMMSPASGGAWTFATIHSFSYKIDGSNPTSGFIMDGGGNLYGSLGGNTVGIGIVYKLSRSASGTWTESNLYYRIPSGQYYNSYIPGLVFDKGSIYFPDSNGGVNCPVSPREGCGMVVKLTPGVSGGPWTSSVVYTFQGQPDGANPKSGLAVGTGGGLYGTTYYGGTANQGTVFKLDP